MRESYLSLGRIVITPGALRAIRAPGQLARMLGLHSTGMWGDIDAEDSAANDHAARTGTGRVLSCYHLDGAPALWVLSDLCGPDTVTTIMQPEDY